jgi:hypothetical protein
MESADPDACVTRQVGSEGARRVRCSQVRGGASGRAR